MQFLLPQITTVLLVAHMALGCCLHHAHVCAANCCSEPTATEVSCPCGTHLHDDVTEAAFDGGQHVGDDGGQGQRHECAGDRCTFLQSQSAPDEIGLHVADLCAWGTVALSGAVVSFRSQPDRNLGQPLSDAGTSLRSHLALRVLLI